MLDTMTLTKAVGAFCGALLIYLLGKWGGEVLYATGGGHGDDHGPAYVIEVASADGPAEDEVVVPFAEIYAAADASKGEKVWKKCTACHKLEAGKNGTGPYLLGVVNRPIGGVDGFGYSGALNAVGDAWTPENLNTFLTGPKSAAPGTSMNFKGLAKPADRANLIAFLETQS